MHVSYTSAEAELVKAAL